MAQERAYTVSEIQELRSVCENKFLWGSYSGPVLEDGTSYSIQYQRGEKTAAVLAETEFWMRAGKTARDLLDSEKAP